MIQEFSGEKRHWEKVTEINKSAFNWSAVHDKTGVILFDFFPNNLQYTFTWLFSAELFYCQKFGLFSKYFLVCDFIGYVTCQTPCFCKHWTWEKRQWLNKGGKGKLKSVGGVGGGIELERLEQGKGERGDLLVTPRNANKQTKIKHYHPWLPYMIQTNSLYSRQTNWSRPTLSTHVKLT